MRNVLGDMCSGTYLVHRGCCLSHIDPNSSFYILVYVAFCVGSSWRSTECFGTFSFSARVDFALLVSSDCKIV